MLKSQTERMVESEEAERGPPALSASVRLHLGRTLRVLLSGSLTAPFGERIETLLDRLDAPTR